MAPTAPLPVALYDGHCRFCTEQIEKLGRMARGRIDMRDFQQPGALDAFPTLTHEACMIELKVVEPDGRISGGAEAIVRVLRAARPVLGRFALVYYVPGLRWIANRAYAYVANRRYEVFGRTDDCDDGTCALHGPAAGEAHERQA